MSRGNSRLLMGLHRQDWIGEFVSVLCAKTLFGGNATMDGILGRFHSLNNDTFADFDFKDVNLLDVEPKAPCAFPKALFACAVNWTVLWKNPGLLALVGAGPEALLVTPTSGWTCVLH